jgi:hypothetical protein
VRNIVQECLFVFGFGVFGDFLRTGTGKETLPLSIIIAVHLSHGLTFLFQLLDSLDWEHGLLKRLDSLCQAKLLNTGAMIIIIIKVVVKAIVDGVIVVVGARMVVRSRASTIDTRSTMWVGVGQRSDGAIG